LSLWTDKILAKFHLSLTLPIEIDYSMKPIYISLLLLLIGCNLKAQNLVPNGDFEGYTVTCPAYITDISRFTGWCNYTVGSPDGFHPCGTALSGAGVPNNAFGTQMPAHGNCYIGFVTQWGPGNPYREYAHTTITPMVTRQVYEVSMSISLADDVALAANSLGAYFYKNGPSTISLPLNTQDRLTETPQIDFEKFGAISEQTDWVRVTDTMMADSAYDHMVLGSFMPNSSITIVTIPNIPTLIAYYYIDSVVVKAIPVMEADINISDMCGGQTVSIPYALNPYYILPTSNVFTAELSNSSGSFATPTNIGSIVSNTSGSVTATIPATIATGTGYKIRIKSTSGDTSTYSNAFTITALHTLTASIDFPACAGDTFHLNSYTSTTGVSYLWNGPNGFSSTNANTFISAISSSQSGKYSITTVHNACIVTDTFTVLVQPKPVITASSNTPVCPGTTMQLTAISSLPGSTFSWAGPNSFSSNTNTSSRTPTVFADQGIYTVSVTKDGCTTKKDIPVIVQITTATPTASSNNPICEGFGMLLNALCATPGVSYSWAGPAGFINNTQSPAITTTSTANSGNYIVHATVNGCVSLPDTVTVQVLPKPYLGNYASPNDTVCEGTVVTFVTVPMTGIVNPTFQWFKNNTLIPGATNLTLITPYATGDSFYCRTYCQNQCGDNLTLYSNKVGMTVMPIVNDLSVTLSSVPAQPLPGNPVTFNAIVVNGGYNPKYQWKKNGNDIFGATYAGYSANNMAPYDKIICCVISSDPCANPITACSDAMVVNFPTSVGEVGNDNVFQLYPNPNDGSFKLKMQNVPCKSIDVVNVNGKVVYQLKTEIQQTEYLIDLPEQLPSGVYMLRAYSDSNIYQKSFTLLK
jgi:hypothetical protein